jgi:hypothetical protein
MLCEAENKMHITGMQYTTDHHNTEHIQYTVLPEMPTLAQLIKIFAKVLWTLGFIMEFYRNVFQRSPKA